MANSRARSTPKASIPIEVRRIRLPEDRAQKYWYRGDPGVTAFAYGLSAVFPDGERFFIDAVRAFRDRISDDDLKKRVRAFIGQEAQHGQIHERYNERAREQGFAVDEIIALCKVELAELRKRVSPEDQLAITCALEHFTAMMAEQLLDNPKMTDGIPSPHLEMWRWHAAEEAEHKAVAFDVYRAVDGGYARRVFHYLLTSLSFAYGTGWSTVHLLRKDGQGRNLAAYLSIVKFLFVEPGLLRAIAPQWFEYLRPDFHPDDRDDSALVERWKRDLAPEFETLSV